jgi:hypothetical protein
LFIENAIAKQSELSAFEEGWTSGRPRKLSLKVREETAKKSLAAVFQSFTFFTHKYLRFLKKNLRLNFATRLSDDDKLRGV